MPGPNANWTAGLSVHYSQDSSLIYWFNGTQAVQVPLGGTSGLGSGPQESLSDHFTLSFWMKHGVTPNKGKKEEETIVCNTVQNGEPSSGHWSEWGNWFPDLSLSLAWSVIVNRSLPFSSLVRWQCWV